MEKYMLIFRGGINHAYNAEDSEAAAKNMQAWMTWMESLGKNGTMESSTPLQPTGKQVNGTNKVVSDGAYEENNERIGGYLIINAKDIDDAVEISKGCPIFKEDGKVEVRPVQNMEM